MICLESVYPHIARELVSRGARFLVVSSNDAGFGRSPITHHMTNRARVRAAETRRWLLRVGQAGVSAVIDPNGRIRRSMGLFEAGLLDTNIELREEETLYVRWGNWWVWVLLPCLLGLYGRVGDRTTLKKLIRHIHEPENGQEDEIRTPRVPGPLGKPPP